MEQKVGETLLWTNAKGVPKQGQNLVLTIHK